MASFERARILRFGWNAARYALGPIGGLLVPWLVYRKQPPEVWGEVAFALTIVTFLAHVVSWGSKEFLLRNFQREPARVDALVWSSLFTRAIVPLCTVVCGILIGDTGSRAMHIYVGIFVIAAAWWFPMSVSATIEAAIVQHKRFAEAFFVEIFTLLLLLFLVGAHGTTSFNTNGLIEAYMVCHVLRAVLLTSISGIGFPVWKEVRIDFRAHYGAALPFFLIGFTGLLASRIDLYTVSFTLDRATIGHYQVISSIFLQFQALAALITAPMTRDLYRLQVGSVSKYARNLRMWALIALPLMCALIWAVLTFFFHFETSWPIHLAGAALVWPVFAYVPMINQVYKHGRERSIMLANGCAAVISCALSWLLLPMLGIAGGLIGAAAGQWFMLAWVSVEERKLHALPGV